MDEVASWSIRAVSGNPVLLTVLGLVLVVPHNVLLQEIILNVSIKWTSTITTYPKLVLSMSKLTEVTIQASSFLLEITTNLGFEPWVGYS